MTSKACCTIPPVVSDTDNYQTQGTYTTISSLRTYAVGPTTSKTGVLVIYDIFGMDFPQTLQGCDIIGSSGHLVVMPDLFDGAPMDMANFPPDTPEKQQALQTFFAGLANPGPMVQKIRAEVLPAVKQTYPAVDRWAVIGYCWGGKIVTLLSAGEGFAASAQLHPAMLDPADAAKITIPHFCLSTKDEDAAATEGFRTVLEAVKGVVGEKSLVLRWEGTFHGFMAARANLKDKENLEYYEKGYKKLVHFLKETL
ncbi:dienelactone hydrolase [Tricharina praecox]|uniref:dienelactone hydrolase n=1 Tax=Tricharina praecox TaxID=43433 RepID=UPI002220D2AD|nr:dienelactone hydrolase [Tricharina praecox]KAI5846186.1 dienelactone hydrolase [Tricharina praecox]